MASDKLHLRLDLIGQECPANSSYVPLSVSHIRWAMTILDKMHHRSLKTDEFGFVTFPNLIPGAQYKLLMFRPSYKELLEFDAKAGSNLKLDDIILE